MCELGNRTLNRIYEARVEEMGVKKPHPECSRWVRPPPTPKNKYGGGGRGGGLSLKDPPQDFPNP